MYLGDIMLKDYLEIGQIGGTHGVRGELRVNPWMDSPDFIKQFKTIYLDSAGEKGIKLISARAHGNVILLRLEAYRMQGD